MIGTLIAEIDDLSECFGHSLPSLVKPTASGWQGKRSAHCAVPASKPLPNSLLHSMQEADRQQSASGLGCFCSLHGRPHD